MTIKFKLLQWYSIKHFMIAQALFLFASLLVSACVSTPHPVPVVERQFGRFQGVPVVKDQAGKEVYIVQRGDTLYSIALKHGLDVNQLAERNGIADPSELRVGQRIELYALSYEEQVPHQEQSAATQPTLFSISQPEDISSNVTGYQLGALPPGEEMPSGFLKTEPKGVVMSYSDAALNQLSGTDKAASLHKESTGKRLEEVDKVSSAKKTSDNGTGRFVSRNSSGIDWGWPADGQIESRFSEKSKGVGITGRIKQPVLASASGTVVYSGSGLRGYGNLVIIKHNDTYLSAYGHNSRVFVREGENVTKGQKIAEMGNADNGAVKLHFEIREKGKPVDPLGFLPVR